LLDLFIDRWLFWHPTILFFSVLLTENNGNEQYCVDRSPEIVLDFCQALPKQCFLTITKGYRYHCPIGYGFWMGSVVGNITGGKYPDIYLANAGLRVPKIVMYGDLKTKTQPLDVEFRLLKNDGKFGFTECAKDMGLRNPGFGWGMVMDDFSNSGSNQIYITENFIGMPMKMHYMIPTPGAFYVKNSEGKYVNTVKQAGLSNAKFGYRAVSLDLNGNGYKDLVVANVDGPMRVFMNNAKMNR
jgi:hypothetical protein